MGEGLSKVFTISVFSFAEAIYLRIISFYPYKFMSLPIT